MALRQLQVAVPKEHAADLRKRCAERGAERLQHVRTGGGQQDDLLLIVCNVGSTGPMVRLLQTFFRDRQLASPEVVILPVATVVPEAANANEGAGRAAWEELRSDIAGGAVLSRGYVLFVVLSAVMATLGLLNNDGAVVIAAMVVAPLFGPLMGLALGVVMADRPLWHRALLAEFVGLVLAIAIGAIAGAFAPGYLILASQQIQSRAHPNLTDIVLALGAGVAGALSIASTVVNALVGVAVAVALMPPAIVIGMGLGHGNWSMALGAGMLVWINVVGGVLAAIVTFRLYHIQPWPRFRVREALRAIRWVSLAAAALLIAAAVPVYLTTRAINRSQVVQSDVRQQLDRLTGGRLAVQGVTVNASGGHLLIDVSAVGAPPPSEASLQALRASLQAELHLPVSIVLHVVPSSTIQAS